MDNSNASPIVADVVQRFYDSLAQQYTGFYADWDAASRSEGEFLRALFRANGVADGASVLDCACGIGTQAIPLAALGYRVAASDLSAGALEEAKRRAAARNVGICFRQADFRALDKVFPERFDAVIAVDNALPHMLTPGDLAAAVRSMTGRLRSGGLFAASIRDYDAILQEKPAYSPPYVHKTDRGRRVLFQTWDWTGDIYNFTQYIIDDEGTPRVSRFECAYRAVRRSELTALLRENGCGEVCWKMPGETGFYQPIVLARKE